MSQFNHRLVTRDNDDDVEPFIETIRLTDVTYNGDGRAALVNMKSDGKQRTKPRVVISGAISAHGAAFGSQQRWRAQPMKSARDARRLQTSKTIVVCKHRKRSSSAG
ncbi:MAG: hypothetical protein ACI9ZF_003729 [Bradyrhizobium sp.]|jgi:hypothetical protein